MRRTLAFLALVALERRMKRATSKQHERAERACFHFLKPVVSTKPLSRHAQARARRALKSFSGCMAGRGYDYFRSRPVVGNLSRGRAFFGFEQADPRAEHLQQNRRFLRPHGVRARPECEARRDHRGRPPRAAVLTTVSRASRRRA